MPRSIDPKERELRRIARNHRAVAQQAEVLANFEEDVPNYLDRSASVALVAADTVVFENYRDPQLCLAWLNAALRGWLRANERFNDMSKRSVLYRYVVLPYPGLLKNWYKRATLVETVLLHLHLQLWHGVICGVIFADPRRVTIAEVTKALNFLAIPAHDLIYDVPSFYGSDSLRTSILSGSTGTSRIDEIRQFVSKNGKLLWLHYDEANFGGPRLDGWRWDTLRAFFRQLYGPNLSCSGCSRMIGSFALDHIAPVSKKYFQTLINFQPLCKSCNSAKKDLEGEDPYRPKIFLPEELSTPTLNDIFRHRPPWLGTLQRPGSQSELFAPDLGLK
jgi:hypothetical protein